MVWLVGWDASDARHQCQTRSLGARNLGFERLAELSRRSGICPLWWGRRGLLQSVAGVRLAVAVWPGVLEFVDSPPFLLTVSKFEWLE